MADTFAGPWAAIPGLAAAGLRSLPPGKGALILILGGLVVLGLVLLFVRFGSASAHEAPRGHPRSEARSFVATLQGPKAFRAVPHWVSGLDGELDRRHLGHGRLLLADAGRCVIQLEGCASCRTAGSRMHACERERSAIEALVRAGAPGARVSEIACDVAGQGRCTFEIFRGSYG